VQCEKRKQLEYGIVRKILYRQNSNLENLPRIEGSNP
jgi:hypothetical protein